MKVIARMLKLLKCAAVLGLLLISSANASAGVKGLGEWGFEGNNAAFVRFGLANEITGHGGCNHFFGSYESFDDDQLRIKPLASTKKLCAPEIMKFESKFISDLQNSYRWRRNGYRLLLLDESNKINLELQQKDWD